MGNGFDGGDPLLSTAEFASDGGYQGQPRRSTSVEALADKVVAAGVRRVGRLLGDESRYDSERLVPSWNPRYIANFDISPLSALVVNKAFTQNSPPATAVSPPAHAASVLAGLLRARGVTVGDTGAARAPANTTRVTSIESPPLSDIAAEILASVVEVVFSSVVVSSVELVDSVVEDGATVPIIYESRMTKWAVRDDDIDEGVGEVVRPVVADGARQDPQRALEVPVLDRRHQAQVGDALPDQRPVEKAHALQVQQHPVVRLGQQREVHGAPLLLCLMEADLVGEDRLARAGDALDDVDARFEQTSRQDEVEARDTGGHALQLLDLR